MYIETSSPRRPGDKAKLVFTVPNNGETSCLSFYYHMYGPTVGTLNVYSGNSKVFNISGYQNHNWILAKTNIILNGLVRNRIVLTHTSSSPSSHHHNHTITIIIITRLKITDSRSPIMMTDQILFSPDKPRFWPVKLMNIIIIFLPYAGSRSLYGIVVQVCAG